MLRAWARKKDPFVRDSKTRRVSAIRSVAPRPFRRIASVRIKPGASCHENRLKAFTKKRRNALSVARRLDFAAYEISEAGQAGAAQFFVRLQIKQDVSTRWADPDEAAAFVVK